MKQQIVQAKLHEPYEGDYEQYYALALNKSDAIRLCLEWSWKTTYERIEYHKKLVERYVWMKNSPSGELRPDEVDFYAKKIDEHTKAVGIIHKNRENFREGNISYMEIGDMTVGYKPVPEPNQWEPFCTFWD